MVRQPLAVKERIAVCPQEINLDKELTAYENLLIYGKLYRTPELKKRIWEPPGIRGVNRSGPPSGPDLFRWAATASVDSPGFAVPAPGALSG